MRKRYGGRKTHTITRTTLAATALIVAASGHADTGRYLAKTRIPNHMGDCCKYTQVVEEPSDYFQEGMANAVGIITFDDPSCMSGDEVEMDVNKMLINNHISGWYSHSDADFGTKVSEMKETSALQMRGQCIQSRKYSAVGIAIDYVTDGGSITKVYHGPTIGGCK